MRRSAVRIRSGPQKMLLEKTQTKKKGGEEMTKKRLKLIILVVFAGSALLAVGMLIPSNWVGIAGLVVLCIATGISLFTESGWG